MTATVDAYTGLKPGPYTHKTIDELFLPGTVPTQKETIRVGRSIDATGLLWQDGCAGPKVTRGYFNLSEVESNFPAWQKANAAWGARAARGPGVRGGPKGTRTSYFYTGSRSRRSVGPGAPRSRRRTLCPLYAAAADLRPVRADPDCRPDPAAARRRRPHPRGGVTGRSADPHRTDDGAPDPPPQNSTIVAPSPPSPRWPGRSDLTSGWLAAAERTASRTAPVPIPWMIRTLSSPASPASSR